MRVLVTGATGFLGSHIVDQLLASGHQVRALVRTLPQRADVELILGDVTHVSSLGPAMAGCDAVIHSAAMLTFKSRDAVRQRDVNVQGTHNVVEAARAAGIRRLVHTSSVAALGRPNDESTRERSGARRGVSERAAPARMPVSIDEDARYDWPVGLTYNESKRDAEALVRGAAGLETISLNPAMVLGPGERYRHSLPLFRIAKWSLLPVVPTGGVTVCDVRDVAAAHVAALTQGTPGARYILGGPQLTFIELMEELAAATGGRAPRRELPPSLLRLGVLPLLMVEKLGVSLPYSPVYAPFLTASSFYSSARAQSELGYRTRDASETIGDAATWYRNQELL